MQRFINEVHPYSGLSPELFRQFVAGVKDVLGKSLGAPNAINTARATMACLAQLKNADEVARLRGKSLEDMLPKGMLRAIAADAPAFETAAEEETDELAAVAVEEEESA